MRNKNIITLMLSIIILFTNFIIPKSFDSIKSYELENLSDNFDILPDQDNGFFLGDKNNNSIKHFYKDNDNFKIENIYENNVYFCIKSVNKNLYAIKNTENTETNSATIFKYNSNDKIFAGMYVFPSLFSPENNAENMYYNSFALDNKENIYFINSNKKLFAKNKNNNENLISMCENYLIVSITINIENNKLYALTEDKKILIFDIPLASENNISFKEINGYSDDYFYFLKENILVSYSGKIYNINNDNISEILVSDSRWPAQTIGTLDGYLICKVSDETINCYEKSSNSDKYIASKKCICDNKILYISTSKDTCIAVLDNNGSKYVKFLSIDDFKDIPQDDTSQENNNNNNENNSKNSNNNNNNNNSNTNNENTNNSNEISNYQISSSTYKIDFQNMRITNVPISTTATTFKQNVIYTGYNISFKSYLGKNIVSGKLGTGTTVNFERDGHNLTFKIIVSGEITGEGNLNSKDLNALEDYLGFKSNLLDEFLLSTDLNSDGVVNTLDLLLMSKIINNE